MSSMLSTTSNAAPLRANATSSALATVPARPAGSTHAFTLTNGLLTNLAHTAHKSNNGPRAWAELFGRRLLKLTSTLLQRGVIADWRAEAQVFFNAMSPAAQRHIVKVARKSGVAAVERDGKRGIKVPGSAEWMMGVLSNEVHGQGAKPLEVMLGVESTAPAVVDGGVDAKVRARAQAAASRVSAAQWARQHLRSIPRVEFSKADSFVHSKMTLLEALVAGPRARHQAVHLAAVVRLAAAARDKTAHSYGNNMILDLEQSMGGTPRRSWNSVPMQVFPAVAVVAPVVEELQKSSAEPALPESMELDSEEQQTPATLSSPTPQPPSPIPSSSSSSSEPIFHVYGNDLRPSLIETPPSPSFTGSSGAAVPPRPYSPNHLAPPPSQKKTQRAHVLKVNARRQSEGAQDQADFMARRRRSFAPQPETPRKRAFFLALSRSQVPANVGPSGSLAKRRAPPRGDEAINGPEEELEAFQPFEGC
ncbi:hypothetical protein RQP46_002908 [Phenoliferia psychrophenolica]